MDVNLNEVRELREKNRELREKLRMLPPLPVHDDPIAQLAVEELKLEAQLRVWQQVKPDVLSREEVAISASCKQKLKNSVEAHQLAICTHSEHLRQLELRVKREGELLKGYERLCGAMLEKLNQLTHHTSVAITVGAITEDCTRLKTKLASFVAERGEGEETRKRKCVSDDGFVQAVELLLKKYEEEGEEGDPYVPMDALPTAHLEILLRAKVVQVHPDDPSRIRILPIHQ
ncbi:hypothetical protein EMCRGX_G002924 [Ephydatia muelleri]